MSDTLKQFLPPHHSTEHAYKMGYDYEMNGANETNCHFSIFSSKENATAWEAGKREAVQDKQRSRE